VYKIRKEYSRVRITIEYKKSNNTNCLEEYSVDTIIQSLVSIPVVKKRPDKFKRQTVTCIRRVHEDVGVVVLVC